MSPAQVAKTKRPLATYASERCGQPAAIDEP
jgi:hypothetical protein